MSNVATNLQALKQAQHTEQRLENPSLKLTEDMRSAANDEAIKTWEYLAAEMQKIGYVKVWPVAFELLGKLGPKGFAALKQTVVAGAVAECVDKFANKHYFEGERLERTMKRIGAIYLLAQRVERAGFVQFSFAPILEKYGVEVPDYLKLDLTMSSKNQGGHHLNGQLRQNQEGVFKNKRPMKPMMVNKLGKLIEIPKTKPIVPLTDEQKVERAKLVAMKKVAKAAAKAAKSAKQAASKKTGEKKRGKK